MTEDCITEIGTVEVFESLFSLGWTVSNLFLEEPPIELAEQITKENPFLLAPLGISNEIDHGLNSLQEFSRDQFGRTPSDVHADLRQEFAALFLGPKPRSVHPYESVYRDKHTIAGKDWGGLLMGKSVEHVRSFWREAGVQSIHPLNHSPDHFGLELGFVSYLGLKFLENGDNQNLEILQRFLREHLLTWGPQFCADLISIDQSWFYKPIAQLASGFQSTLSQFFTNGNYLLHHS